MSGSVMDALTDLSPLPLEILANEITSYFDDLERFNFAWTCKFFSSKRFFSANLYSLFDATIDACKAGYIDLLNFWFSGKLRPKKVDFGQVAALNGLTSVLRWLAELPSFPLRDSSLILHAAKNNHVSSVDYLLAKGCTVSQLAVGLASAALKPRLQAELDKQKKKLEEGNAAEQQSQGDPSMGVEGKAIELGAFPDLDLVLALDSDNAVEKFLAAQPGDNIELSSAVDLGAFFLAPYKWLIQSLIENKSISFTLDAIEYLVNSRNWDMLKIVLVAQKVPPIRLGKPGTWYHPPEDLQDGTAFFWRRNTVYDIISYQIYNMTKSKDIEWFFYHEYFRLDSLVNSGIFKAANWSFLQSVLDVVSETQLESLKMSLLRTADQEMLALVASKGFFTPWKKAYTGILSHKAKLPLLDWLFLESKLVPVDNQVLSSLLSFGMKDLFMKLFPSVTSKLDLVTEDLCEFRPPLFGWRDETFDRGQWEVLLYALDHGQVTVNSYSFLAKTPTKYLAILLDNGFIKWSKDLSLEMAKQSKWNEIELCLERNLEVDEKVVEIAVNFLDEGGMKILVDKGMLQLTPELSITLAQRQKWKLLMWYLPKFPYSDADLCEIAIQATNQGVHFILKILFNKCNFDFKLLNAHIHRLIMGQIVHNGFALAYLFSKGVDLDQHALFQVLWSELPSNIDVLSYIIRFFHISLIDGKTLRYVYEKIDLEQPGHPKVIVEDVVEVIYPSMASGIEKAIEMAFLNNNQDLEDAHFLDAYQNFLIDFNRPFSSSSSSTTTFASSSPKRDMTATQFDFVGKSEEKDSKQLNRVHKFRAVLDGVDADDPGITFPSKEKESNQPSNASTSFSFFFAAPSSDVVAMSPTSSGPLTLPESDEMMRLAAELREKRKEEKAKIMDFVEKKEKEKEKETAAISEMTKGGPASALDFVKKHENASKSLFTAESLLGSSPYSLSKTPSPSFSFASSSPLPLFSQVATAPNVTVITTSTGVSFDFPSASSLASSAASSASSIPSAVTPPGPASPSSSSIPSLAAFSFNSSSSATSISSFPFPTASPAPSSSLSAFSFSFPSTSTAAPSSAFSFPTPAPTLSSSTSEFSFPASSSPSFSFPSSSSSSSGSGGSFTFG